MSGSSHASSLLPLDISSAFDKQAALDVIYAHPGGDKLMDLTFLHAISTENGKKRTLSLSHDDDDDDGKEQDEEDDATSADGSDSKETPEVSKTVVTKERQQQPKKQRKPTHVIRREAKEKLLEELQQLEARAALLREEAGIEDPREVAQKLTLNADLREAILQQDLILASSQSAFTGYMNSRATSPLETYIHLTRDWDQRRTLLLGMKDRKIRDANRFLIERTRHLNPFKASSEMSHFESAEGDLCTIKIDVMPFEGVTSVRQVFDALQFYFVNLEISLSEMSGNVTIRENDDNTDKAVLHHRLVTTEPTGMLIEKNAVLFIDQSAFEDPSVASEDHWAIAVSDFVNQDDLYPYCPKQRLRRDATTAIKLSAHRRPLQRTDNSSNGSTKSTAQKNEVDEGSELVVVLTRWYLLRLRKPAFDVPKELFHAVSTKHGGGIDVMLRSIRQGIFPTAGPWQAN